MKRRDFCDKKNMSDYTKFPEDACVGNCYLQNWVVSVVSHENFSRSLEYQ